jgi:hypothetical protein
LRIAQFAARAQVLRNRHLRVNRKYRNPLLADLPREGAVVAVAEAEDAEVADASKPWRKRLRLRR